MKTMVALSILTISGCAQLQSFIGMQPTECEAKAKEIQARVEKVTMQMCQSQQEYKSKAAILDAAIETIAK